MNSYTFKVNMPCYGCVNSVIESLSNIDGSVSIDFDNKLVNVKSCKYSDEIINIIKSGTGKKYVELVNI